MKTILKQDYTNSVWKTNAKHGSFIKMFKWKYFQTVVLKQKIFQMFIKIQRGAGCHGVGHL